MFSVGSMFVVSSCERSGVFRELVQDFLFILELIIETAWLESLSIHGVLQAVRLYLEPNDPPCGGLVVSAVHVIGVCVVYLQDYFEVVVYVVSLWLGGTLANPSHWKA